MQAGCSAWGSRVIVPTPEREAMLSELHECHPGIVRMKAVARSFVWWPGIDAEIWVTVRACGVCQGQRNAPHTVQLHPWQMPGQPWHRVHLDYAGPMDSKMELVVVDALKKFIDAHFVHAAASSATITKLRQAFATHGLPSVLVCDSGTCFKSSEFEAFFRLNGFQYIASAPFRPASNGTAYAFYAGDAVWAMNVAGTPKWQPEVLEEKIGPMRLAGGQVWRRLSGHLCKRLPAETKGMEPE